MEIECSLFNFDNEIISCTWYYQKVIKFRTEPIPKKFLQFIPNHTEIWKLISQTPNNE